MYLVVTKHYGSYVTRECPCTSHDLGKVVDGIRKVFKFEDGKFYVMKVSANERNRWVYEWVEVEVKENEY